MTRKTWFIALIVVLMIGTSIPAAEAEDGPGTPVEINLVDSQSADTFWTEAKMAEARPYPIPTYTSDQTREGMFELKDYGQPLTLMPGSNGTKAAANKVSLEESLYNPLASFYNYPPPFNRYKVPGVKRFPNRAIGKLYFVQGGYSYVCSASVVQDSALLTAGHCLSNGSGGFSNNILFVPGKKGPSEPYGTWKCGKILIPNGYLFGGNPEYDYAFCKVIKKGGTTSIGSVTGYLGVAWGGTNLRMWNSFGYPAAPPFNGQSQQTCQASLSSTVNLVSGGYDNIGMGCDMTGGSSGGPWVWLYNVGGGNYANGVNSFVLIKNGVLQGKQMFSPYFSNDLQNFYNIFKNW